MRHIKQAFATELWRRNEPSTTLADFKRHGIPKSVFLYLWVVGLWRGRPWLAGHRTGKKSLDAFSSRFWIGWVTRRGDGCVPLRVGTDPVLAIARALRRWRNTEISPLFKCDSATRAFYGLKDGKITVNFSGWEQNRVVLKGAKPLR